MKNIKISLLSLLLVSSSAWAMQVDQISGEEVQRLIDGARGNARGLKPSISEAELAVITRAAIVQLLEDAVTQGLVFSPEAERVLRFEGGAEVQAPALAARPASPAPQVQQPQAPAPQPAPAAGPVSPVPAPALTQGQRRAQVREAAEKRLAESKRQKAAGAQAQQPAAAPRADASGASSSAATQAAYDARNRREAAREGNQATAYGRCKNQLQDWYVNVQATKPVQYVKTNPKKSITGLLALCAAAWFFWTAEEEEDAVKAPTPVQQKTGLFGARQAAPVRTVKKESFAVRAKKTVKNWWNGFYTWATKDVK